MITATQTVALHMSEPLTLTSLPLFPLGTVLFPGGTLTLRIFEVRYLDMIGKCHKTGAPFGVVTLTKGSEVRRPAPDASGGNGFAQEAFHSVGTLAAITEFSAPQSGLMVIRCSGTQRFRIASQRQLRHGLWTANVSQQADDLPVKIPDDLQDVANALESLINSLHTRAVPPEQMPLQPPYFLNDCGWVANRWCELLPMPTTLKQQLMALDNPLLRLELVSDFLARSDIAR
jgi:Lon protease-like protein